jgi:hypothetical protein
MPIDISPLIRLTRKRDISDIDKERRMRALSGAGALNRDGRWPALAGVGVFTTGPEWQGHMALEHSGALERHQ